jgi:hypothetical protein
MRYSKGVGHRTNNDGASNTSGDDGRNGAAQASKLNPTHSKISALRAHHSSDRIERPD